MSKVIFIKTRDELTNAFEAWRAAVKAGTIRRQDYEGNRYAAELGGDFDFKISPDADQETFVGSIPDGQNDGYLFLRGLVSNTLKDLGKQKQAAIIDKIYEKMYAAFKSAKANKEKIFDMNTLAGAFDDYIQRNKYVGAAAQIMNNEFFDQDRNFVRFSPMVSEKVVLDEDRGGVISGLQYEDMWFPKPQTKTLQSAKNKKASDEKKIADARQPKQKWRMLDFSDYDLDRRPDEKAALEKELKQLYPGIEDPILFARIKMGKTKSPGDLKQTVQKLSGKDFTRLSPKFDLGALRAGELLEVIWKRSLRIPLEWFDAIMEKLPDTKEGWEDAESGNLSIMKDGRNEVMRNPKFWYDEIVSIFGINKDTVDKIIKKFDKNPEKLQSLVDEQELDAKAIKQALKFHADFMEIVYNKIKAGKGLSQVKEDAYKPLKNALDGYIMDSSVATKYKRYYRDFLETVSKYFYNNEIRTLEMPREKPWGLFTFDAREKNFFEDIEMKLQFLQQAEEKVAKANEYVQNMPELDESEKIILGTDPYKLITGNNYQGAVAKIIEDKHLTKSALENTDYWKSWMDKELNYKSADTIVVILYERIISVLDTRIFDFDEELKKRDERIKDMYREIGKINAALTESEAVKHKSWTRRHEISQAVANLDFEEYGKFREEKEAAGNKKWSKEDLFAKAKKRMENSKGWGKDLSGVVEVDKKLRAEKQKIKDDEEAEEKRIEHEARAVETARALKEQERKNKSDTMRLLQLRNRSELI